MVRLGDSRDCILILINAVSIPVWCDWESRSIFCPLKIMSSFNSSMVRLGEIHIYSYHCFTQVSIPVWCDWEFTGKTNFTYQNSFNSSMVRLGVFIHRVKESDQYWFQFQYGAIGSLNR